MFRGRVLEARETCARPDSLLKTMFSLSGDHASRPPRLPLSIRRLGSPDPDAEIKRSSDLPPNNKREAANHLPFGENENVKSPWLPTGGFVSLRLTPEVKEYR